MITREVDYAIRAVLCLASLREEERRISAATLSEEMGIPYRFLRNICRLLVEGGLLESRRGNGGGLLLMRAPAQITLYDVIQAINPRGCILNSCLAERTACARTRHCQVHGQLARIQDRLDSELKGVTFASLLSDQATR